jgi:UDP-glucose 4-epimerase
LKDKRVSLVQGDIRDVALMQKLAQGMDAVIHMATLRITACAENPREAHEVMCDGTFNAVEAAHRAGVKKFITASSASIYGLADSFPTREDHHPYNNRTWYGATKMMLEGLLRSYNDMYGFPYVAHRYFNVYGPRMDLAGVYTEVLIRWLDAIEANQPPLIFGDGSQSMDFVFVGDVAHANVLAAQSDVTDEVFNVGTGTQTSLSELCDLLLAMTGSALRPEYRDPRKVANVQARRATVEKAAGPLGFRATVTLQEGLRELIHWRHSMKAAPVVVEAV